MTWDWPPKSLLAFPFKAKRPQCVWEAIQRGSEEGCVSPYSSVLKVSFRQQDHRQSLPSILQVHILDWAVLSAFYLPTAYSQPLPRSHILLSMSELGYPEILDKAEPKACCEGDGPSPSSPGCCSFITF